MEVLRSFNGVVCICTVGELVGAKRREQKGGVKGKGDGDGDNGEAEAEVDR